MGDRYIYKELSHKIVGAAFEVYNTVGFGMPEKYIQAAYAEELKAQGLKFEREFYLSLKYHYKTLTKHYADFKIEEKVIVELKIRPYLGYVHIKQVEAYLISSGCKLAIILYFTKDGVKFRRVLSPNNEQK